MVWCASVLADESNERCFPSSAPSIKRLLPHQSFTRGLISMKSMPRLVPALRLQTPTSLLGLRTYLLSTSSISSSSSHSLLHVPLFKSSQASASLCLPPSFFFQVKTGGSKQPGSFPLLFFYPLSCFLCVAALSLSLHPSLFLQIELRENLDLPF